MEENQPYSSVPRILFVGSVVPDEAIQKLSLIDQLPGRIAANKLQWDIINGIEAITGTPVHLISSLFVRDYPYSPLIFVHHLRWSHKKGSHDIMLPYLNILLFKHVTTFISCFLHTCVWLIKNRRYRKRIILLYYSHSAHMYAVLGAVRLLGGKVVNIITDMPSSPNVLEGRFKKAIRFFDKYLLLKGTQKMNGLIVLTPQLAEDFAPRVPWLLMEGSISLDEIQRLEKRRCQPVCREKERPFTIMYTGTINKAFGIQLLIDAFSLLPEGNYCLWLFGEGDMAERVKEASRKDGRIRYEGFLPSNRDLLQMTLQATVLVNPRPISLWPTSYSFPSKLLQYMMTGRPVVTTKWPGIPKEYHKYLILLEDESPTALAALFQELQSRDCEVLNRLGLRAREFVKQHKNHLVQGKRIYAFINSL